MKNIISIFCILLSKGIYSQDTIKNIPIGKPHTTHNPNIPQIYSNGYYNYEIVRIPTDNNDTSYEINELRFNRVFSAFYTKKLMYDNFGMWDKEIRTENNERHPILLWKKRKIFENDNTLYDIYADGKESHKEIYASIIILNEDQQDCLQEGNQKKENITAYFSDGIKRLKNNRKFDNIYWSQVEKYKKE